jgi:LPXTG-motif cell wall-anchored protein
VPSVHFQGLAPMEAFSIATTLLERPTRDTRDPNASSTWAQIRAGMPYIALGGVLLLALLLVGLLRRRERMPLRV